MDPEKQSRRSMIVAMKGHPGTGKTTLARAIAAALRSPLLDKDDVRDCTIHLEPQVSSPSLNDLSYWVLFRMAETQLQLGLSVVVDSPLSRKAHFERLAQMGEVCGAQVVVVECRPKDEREWRRRLEERGRAQAQGHKPSTWEELERLVEGYGGSWDYEVDGANVRRILVDTTAVVADPEEERSMLDLVLGFICAA